MPAPSVFLNPDALATPSGFSHVAVCGPGRMVFISGQVAYDRSGAIVGAGDIGAQTRQVLLNLSAALEAAGARFEHVVKLTFFVRGLDDDAIRQIRSVRRDFLSADHPPASTMVGVAALAKPELLLEVEAVAMLPEAA